MILVVEVCVSGVASFGPVLDLFCTKCPKHVKNSTTFANLPFASETSEKRRRFIIFVVVRVVGKRTVFVGRETDEQKKKNYYPLDKRMRTSFSRSLSFEFFHREEIHIDLSMT